MSGYGLAKPLFGIGPLVKDPLRLIQGLFQADDLSKGERSHFAHHLLLTAGDLNRIIPCILGSNIWETQRSALCPCNALTIEKPLKSKWRLPLSLHRKRHVLSG